MNLAEAAIATLLDLSLALGRRRHADRLIIFAHALCRHDGFLALFFQRVDADAQRFDFGKNVLKLACA
jgi:hypothetical protein